ncbi:hypothetical protein BDR05DRAFT_971262 [Suillus weaverae]|nr:hypothetical protein BDR05DRAFT_971262 [Suillus weaverae]
MAKLRAHSVRRAFWEGIYRNFPSSVDEQRIAESMTSHRAQTLLARSPNALAFGLQEVHPDPVEEPGQRCPH